MLITLPAVKVPLLLKLPLTVSVAGAVKVPELIVSPEAVMAVVLPPTVNVCPVLPKVKVLNVWLEAVPFMACEADVLLKLTVVFACVNVPPLFVQLPPKLMDVPDVPAASVPFEPIVTFPVTDVAPAVEYPTFKLAAVEFTELPFIVVEPPTCKFP